MIFDPTKLLLIAGPCSLESEAVCRTVAAALAVIAREHPELRIVFKGSFDKEVKKRKQECNVHLALEIQRKAATIGRKEHHN